MLPDNKRKHRQITVK